jgi:sucrose-6-phosphate hydrolase SacC (GH32 family)
MNWKKHGKIFDPTEHKLANNCVEFAQSPQTLVFDDFVRIYFSTREVDQTNGKFLSHISFIDIDRNFKTILSVSKNPVIPLGKLGTFDEHGIFPINVVRDTHQILAYTCGWSRRVSVSVETSIGLAVSHDEGLTFQKLGDGPILTSSPNEPFLVGDGFVLIADNTYHMWYIFGTKWIDNQEEESARVYKIGYAESKDGINWIKSEGKQIIPDKLNENECQALPTVVFADNKYHMFFCYREAIGFRKDKNKGYKIGYASSVDLKNWQRNDALLNLDFSKGEWDSDMQCYPHAFKLDEKIFLLYNGNQFGKFGFGLAELLSF